jgi:PAT family beta-lactamase induction signal transducer AmpG
MPPRVAPLWLMGLTNSLFGMYGGVVLICVPLLLSRAHVPETQIAATTAIGVSPGFWSFLFSPILDVRYSRRWYATLCAVAAAVLLVIALLNLEHLALVVWLLLGGYFFACMYQSALGGWLSSITTTAQESRISSWVTIGNVSGGGIMAITSGELTTRVSPTLAAFVLGAAVLLPIAVFPFMPAPPPDRRLATESFGQFSADVLKLLKRREVLIAIVLFLAPAGTFSLTNFLGGLGEDFHASSHFVSLVGGAGMLAGGIVGCLAYRFIDRWLPVRYLYLAIGLLGALFTLMMIVLPRDPLIFAVAFIGENAFQGLAITMSVAISFETIGTNNPLAATTFSLCSAAYNVPITYMLLVDGWGYGKQGVAGGFGADALAGLIACVLLWALLWCVYRRSVPPVAVAGTT